MWPDCFVQDPSRLMAWLLYEFNIILGRGCATHRGRREEDNYSVAGWNNLLNFRDIVVLFIAPKVNLAID
jgi:hypothetical protein